MSCGALNRLGLLLRLAALAVVLVAAPIPLAVTVQNPARKVTIYPNLLFAVPLNLLTVLLLYGATAETHESGVRAVRLAFRPDECV